MNAALALPVNNQLPAILLGRRTASAPERRHRIGDLDLATAALDRFNALLSRLDRHRHRLDADSIASAARELCDSSLPQAVPACITARLRRATAMICMLGDPTWATAGDAGEAAQQAIDYLRRSDDLIPDSVLQVGRLDDAIVIEAAWPRVAAELGAYLDFCHLRRVEAGLRKVGEHEVRFTRTDWELARQSKAPHAHRRWNVHGESFLPASAVLFRIH